MLNQLSILIGNIMTHLIYGLSYLKESTSKFYGHSCKLTDADVEGYIDLSFLLNNIPYRIRFKRQFGPPDYTRIEKKNGEPVTKEVAQFSGPCRNFYGIPTTPQLLGFDSLKVFYRSGESKIFSKNEVIILKK